MIANIIYAEMKDRFPVDIGDHICQTVCDYLNASRAIDSLKRDLQSISEIEYIERELKFTVLEIVAFQIRNFYRFDSEDHHHVKRPELVIAALSEMQDECGVDGLVGSFLSDLYDAFNIHTK